MLMSYQNLKAELRECIPGEIGSSPDPLIVPEIPGIGRPTMLYQRGTIRRRCTIHLTGSQLS